MGFSFRSLSKRNKILVSVAALGVIGLIANEEESGTTPRQGVPPQNWQGAPGQNFNSGNFRPQQQPNVQYGAYGNDPEAQMRGIMQQTEMNAEASLQNYIEQARPQLEQETGQYNHATGQRLTVEQYTRQKVQAEASRRMAASGGGGAGTNPMFEQQKQMFAAGQAAHQQRQAGYAAQQQNWASGQQQIESNYQGWRGQQQQIDGGNSRFIQQGIQGNQYYRNTETGEVAELPFAGNTGVYQNPNGDTWASGRMGEFKQIGPNGEIQEMESIE